MKSTNIGTHPRKVASPGHSPKTTLLSITLDNLRDYISNASMAATTEAVLAVLAFAGLLSATLGEPAIRTGAIVATTACTVALFAFLTASKLHLLSRATTAERLIRDYCFALEERYHHSCQPRTWDHVIQIDARGNTVEEIECTIVAESDFVEFFSLWAGAAHTWPERFQGKVRFSVTTSTNGRKGGVRPRAVTHTWYQSAKIAITVHLASPLEQGNEASFNFRLYWPLKCVPLIRRHAAEDFVRIFSAPLKFLRYTVVLPQGHQARFDSIGLDDDLDCDLQTSVNENGQTQFTLTASDVPADHRIGMRLDLI
ncbi:hypothetical protein [Kutzneria chonburiensis]|uniref:Uncharacterized protein n=1 Tax=Kutzneria chonburiensis TaxID=1483604 RepID=A0ABV6N2C2_9PSEU|nr:hypothetical protein [Kutzneria chonburiensis]